MRLPARPAHPIALITVTLALAAGGCSRSRSEPGGKKAPPSTVRLDAGAGGTPAPVDQQIALGRAIYTKHCALCHGPEAKGYAADNAPSLVNPSFLDSVDNVFFARSIELGRPGTPMAGYGRDVGGPLDDAQIAALIAFFRADRPALPTPPAVAATGDVTRGRAIYDGTCKKCHGDPAVRGTAPHLANPVFITLARDEFISYAIRNGRPGTPMERFALDDQQIADVIALLRSWGPNKPITAPTTPPPAPPTDGPVVINPKGKAPSFTLREDRFVPADQVKAALDGKRKLVIIDARPPSDWSQLRIPGAISVPHYQHEALTRVPNDDTWVVAYCACPHHASGEIVDELRKRGYKHTAILDEGILVWNQRGYPTTGENAEALRHSAAPAPLPGMAPAPAPHQH